uniref:Hereditary hemochromatosis protein homolog n=1 Tax=Sinocyclocheilus rhinocerous TaxID=307959 RepID=A0A673NKB9_9TELE
MHVFLLIMAFFNTTLGAEEHAYQQFIGCAFNNEGQVSRFWRYGYDGRDIMHVDLAKEAVVATSEPGKSAVYHCNLDAFDAHIYVYIKYILYLFAKPAVYVSSGGEKDQEYLKCAVHGFYPNIIRVRWTQNRRPVYFGVSTTGVLPHKDGTFQMISYLSLSNVSAQSVTCEIEHLSIDGILRIAYGKNLCFYHKSQRFIHIISLQAIITSL